MDKIFIKLQDVLVKDKNSGVWKHGFYDRFDDSTDSHSIIIRDENKYTDSEIVSYNDETAFLEGTTEPYYSWNPVPGTIIAVRDNPKAGWSARVFVERQHASFVCVPYGMDWETYKKDSIGVEYWAYGEPFKNHFQVEE